MRGLKFGIVGLALAGVAAAPQAASAGATVGIDIDTMSLSGSVTGGTATLTYSSFFSGQTLKTTTGNGASTMTGTSKTSSSIGFELTGSADGDVAGVDSYLDVYYGSGSSRNTVSDANTLGVLLTVSNISSASTLALTYLIDGVLTASVTDATGEMASSAFFWTIQMQTSSNGTNFSNWSTPTYVNHAASAGGANPDSASSDLFNTATLQYSLTNPALIYRFRMVGYASGIADSDVPLPAALPMLGLALGGLGLMARRRKAA